MPVARGPDALVTLVPLAPMTNIALQLRTHPEAAAGLREIVFMGGGAHVGNATASAEFNVFHDPEADAATIGDGGAVCAVIDRAAVRTERLPIRAASARRG